MKIGYINYKSLSIVYNYYDPIYNWVFITGTYWKSTRTITTCCVDCVLNSTNWSTSIETYVTTILHCYSWFLAINWLTYCPLNEVINSTKESPSTGENKILYGTTIKDHSDSPQCDFVARFPSSSSIRHPDLLTKCPQKSRHDRQWVWEWVSWLQQNKKY